MEKKLKSILALFTIISVVLILVACGNSNHEMRVVKIGLVGEKNEPWEYVKKKLEKENIELKLIKFTDYRQPIVALEEGDIDLHSALTEIYMDNINKESGYTNTTIAYTTLNPLGIYSEKIKDIKELKDGSEVAIPNDVSNESRALLLLQTAGLIKVDKSKGLLPSVSDITENTKQLKIKTLDSGQTARAMSDVEISLINNDKAVDAGLTPTEDAIFLEPVSDSSKPYYNVIAARKKEQKNELYKKVVAAYQTDEVKKIIEESTKKSSIPVW
ncbi:MetQ/NlpA family ABC transporter substrate-binding protein [Enterococcus faecalis]|uniref:MetQ/NlpA family ABC transporter substrate-binding protein n=1 Tax=Enterococcus faecalis TaxID=1351 RepID=UPI00035479A6|nr:MetQ/NlpA family ABC transporter substrate-binding protein [Enterococcus faecalis]EPI37104.1 putative D-methionine-binding lipoprotein MetQ [Enterococcus faecalis LA3B-2]HAP3558574.1 MetQ/NlpA family ABC transporter substrate-binding protein [Enterococcus faecalis]HBI2046293.1 MetQ/NlpA family ABC transporter substrate-binding protein [Enterococcus faecalis]